MFRQKIHIHDLIAGGIILAATLLHLVLIGLGWPLTNSDEGTMGIMALHIAYHGDHPTFFYGQHYMGSWEALVGAGLFHLFGSSLFTLRLGTVLMITLALLALYLLSRLLFPRGWAVVSLLMAAFSSGFVMAQEIRAIGGYAETLLFGSLLFLTATWLALAYDRQQPARQMGHWPIYLVWGLIAGLGLWTDLLILPAIFASGLLLLITCWRELIRPLPLFSLLAGVIIGAFPLLNYNLHVPADQSSLAILARLRSGSAGTSIYTLPAILQEIHRTFQISLPMMTGEPFCPVAEHSYQGPSSPHTLFCSLAHGGWSLGYLLLLALSIALSAWGIWRIARKRGQVKNEPALRIELRKQLARLLLLVSALLTLASYTISNSPLTAPASSARYLILLLVATPAVFWPLWLGLQSLRTSTDFVGRALRALCALALLCFCSLSITGSALAFTDVPAAAAQNQSDANLIHELSRLSISTIYTNYWTCGKIAFESNEHIICAVLDKQMQVDPVPGHNRYPPYVSAVRAAHTTAYVFSTDPAQFPAGGIYLPLIDPHAAASSLPEPYRSSFTRIILGGYIIYVPKH
jgi:hypothetical protein